MRNLLVIIILTVLLTSCGPYQKALKDNDVSTKYKLANEYYETGKETGKKNSLRRAVRLLEQILPQFRGKPQGEHLAFIYADSYYRLKDYFNAGYQFERFTTSYDNSDKVEEAAFKGAKSYYYLSPRHSLDQTETDKALAKFEAYLTKYPGGEHIAEANKLVTELHEKLETKEFKIAELYYHQDDYKAAVTALNNFINENPGSGYRERAYYYKMDAEYTLAINSYRNVMKERLENSKTYSEDYLKYFPDGDYVSNARDIITDVEKRLKEF